MQIHLLIMFQAQSITSGKGQTNLQFKSFTSIQSSVMLHNYRSKQTRPIPSQCGASYRYHISFMEHRLRPNILINFRFVWNFQILIKAEYKIIVNIKL